MNALIDFHFDFETRSCADLTEVGAVKYATHPTTEATAIAWAFGRSGVIRSWRKGQPLHPDLIAVMTHPERYRCIAWNLQFDYLIWTLVFSKLTPPAVAFKRPEIANLEDAMALSCHFRTGGSLESCSKFLGIEGGKDKDGRALMMKQSKPRNGKWYELTEEEWRKFLYYAERDVDLMRQCFYRLPPLPPQERWTWEWNFKHNLRGIKVDVELVKALKEIVDANLPKLAAEFESIVGCGIGSNVKVKTFFKQFFPWIQDMREATRDQMFVKSQGVPAHVMRALEIKHLAGSTSISKLPKILTMLHAGRVYELLAYHWAGTKRFAGRGVQPQNFPRVDGSLADNYFDPEKPNYTYMNFDVPDLASEVRRIAPTLKDPIGFVKNMLRRVWLPTHGKFLSGDFSKIEPTVLFWLCGLGHIPKKWYEELAAEIYNKMIEEISKDGPERQVGKTGQLSFGYGSGWKAFRLKLFQDTGILLTKEQAKKAVSAYRTKYKEITQFWKDLENAFRRAIYGDGTALCNGKVYVLPMQAPWKGVEIRLPSGGYLYYHQAREHEKTYCESTWLDEDGEKVEIGYKKFCEMYPTDHARATQQQWLVKKRWVLQYLEDAGKGMTYFEDVYSGSLTENVVSATAREALIPAMWRLEDGGFDVPCTVHDEVWGDGIGGAKLFEELMSVLPVWAQDMRITTDVKEGDRYLK